jgi:hypothetical protein
MKDFKNFLEKVLAPIQGEARTEHAPADLTTPGKEQTAREVVPDKELERRYIEVMNALFVDAVERRAINVFTDVVTWKLAMVAYHFGPGAAGDVMRKLGAHLVSTAQAEEAQREAKQAEKAGRRPN